MTLSQQHKACLVALTAFVTWGLVPIYFKLLEAIPAYEILSHRMLWGFIFILLLLALSQGWASVKHTWQNKKTVLYLGLGAAIVGTNWLVYIWAVINSRILEVSLGYFMGPLCNILLGLAFLNERLRPMQSVGVLLAATGVLLQFWLLGTVPLVSLALSISFGLYGLLHKKVLVEAKASMFFEMLWLLPIAIIYLFFIADSPTSHLPQNSWSLNGLLALAGVVSTIPLLLFNIATKHLSLSTLGFLQYVTPSILFFLAVGLYNEPIALSKLLTFAFIWLGLIFFSADAWYKQRHNR